VFRPHIIRWNDISHGQAKDNPDDIRYGYRILGEGDSWFTIGGIPPANLLHPLQFSKETIIVTLATPGDVIRNMADIVNNKVLKMALSEKFGYRWHAILFSGGGNDLIDYAKDLIAPPGERPANPADPAEYFLPERVDTVMGYIKDGYRRVVALRDAPDSSCAGKPLITHCYDLATPRDSPAKFGVRKFGPWLFPAFTAGEIPQADWNGASDFLLRRLRQTLLELAQELPRFHVVDTIGTLRRAALGATGDSNDWDNEIHPNMDGYSVVAAKLQQKLEALLPP
jgi:hypothetical protein